MMLDKGTRLTEEIMAEVDALMPSPSDRAKEIWTAVFEQLAHGDNENIGEYDLQCFCVEYLGTLAVGPLKEDTDYVALAKRMSKWLYNLHYFYLGAEDNGRAREGIGEDSGGSTGADSTEGTGDTAGTDPGEGV